MGGVQSFLIRAILLSGKQHRKVLPLCCVVYITVTGCEGRDQTVIGCIVSYIPSLNDSRGFGGVLGDIPLLGGRVVCYDVLWRTSITRSPGTAGTMPVASGSCGTLGNFPLLSRLYECAAFAHALNTITAVAPNPNIAQVNSSTPSSAPPVTSQMSTFHLILK